jgi:hypothetical protein
LNFF